MHVHVRGLFAASLVVALLGPMHSSAQHDRRPLPDRVVEQLVPARDTVLPRPAVLLDGVRGDETPGRRIYLREGGWVTNNVLLTGYWPPTNEMLRPFSQDPAQNPDGWVGENWLGYGFDVYAFFPEFPGGLDMNPKGDGDFEVDYQDTSNDWWPLLNQMRPVAIITFSRWTFTVEWLFEGGNRNYMSSWWIADYLAPLRPTPDLPSYYEPHLSARYSTLPIALMMQELNALGLPIQPVTRPLDDNGFFLSNYIGYHGCWWHDLNSDPSQDGHNVAAGHVHVGGQIPVDQARSAAFSNVEVLLNHVRASLNVLGDVDGDGQVGLSDLSILLSNYGDAGPHLSYEGGDLNEDGEVGLADLSILLSNFGLGF